MYGERHGFEPFYTQPHIPRFLGKRLVQYAELAGGEAELAAHFLGGVLESVSMPHQS